MNCSNCEPTLVVGKKSSYVLISGSSPPKYLCNSCFGKDDYIPSGESVNHLPMFRRWRCLTHQCGSYNFNNLGRHEMPWCSIEIEQTVGVIKPGTYGGFNGDVSRHYFKDWYMHSREKEEATKVAIHNKKQVIFGPRETERRRR